GRRETSHYGPLSTGRASIGRGTDETTISGTASRQALGPRSRLSPANCCRASEIEDLSMFSSSSHPLRDRWSLSGCTARPIPRMAGDLGDQVGGRRELRGDAVGVGVVTAKRKALR